MLETLLRTYQNPPPSLKFGPPSCLQPEDHLRKYIITNVAKMLICQLRGKQTIDHITKIGTKKKTSTNTFCLLLFDSQILSFNFSLFVEPYKIKQKRK